MRRVGKSREGKEERETLELLVQWEEVVRESRVNQLRNKENGRETHTGTTFHFVQDTFNGELNMDLTFSNDYQDSSDRKEC